MLAVLIPICLALISILIAGAGEKEASRGGLWHGQVLAAAAIWSVLLVIITELLSALDFIALIPLGIAWMTVLGLLLLAGWRTGIARTGLRAVLRLILSARQSDQAPLIPMSILFVVLLAVALIAPPNNIDTLQYHMPRVDHWAQNHSLRHFAAAYDSQNNRPYWAELVILNLRVLSGGDGLANLVQWSTFLGAAIAAFGIAAILGGDRRVRWLAAAATFSVPMALLQATTPKNDVASSFWVLASAYFVVLHAQRDLTRMEGLGLAGSLAVGILTKGTVIPFMALLLFWYGFVLLRRGGWRRASTRVLLVGAVILITNGTFWARNVDTYGGPFGSVLPLQTAASDTHIGLTLDPADSDDARGDDLQLVGGPLEPGEMPPRGSRWLMDGWRLVKEQLSRLLRMMALHFVSPFGAVNRGIFALMRLAPGLFSESFVGFLETAAWNNEMTAGNPVHLLLILIGGGAIAAGAFRRNGIGPLSAYVGVSFIGYGLISFAHCSDSMYCLRYQLSFFFLGAPIIAMVVGRLRKSLVWLGTAGFILYAVPYVAINNMRPVIGRTPWPTRVESVFVASANDILFAQNPEIADEYEYIIQAIRTADCTEVGLSLTRDDMEYTFWWLLKAPQSGVSLYHLRATEDTRRYLLSDVQPCAVICTNCAEMVGITDLPLVNDFGHVALFLAPPARP